MNRIDKLCTYFNKCDIFADIACDHGYFAQYMLKNNLCNTAIISDISCQCLKKAETLLSTYINNGKCRSVCCDGLTKIDNADEIVIAGIGGEEIVKILKEGYIPQNFIFQPMKNSEVLRKYLLDLNCTITVDDIFTDKKKYYFVIKGNATKSLQKYSKYEIMYGKNSIKNPILKTLLTFEIKKNQEYLNKELSQTNYKIIQEKIKFMQEALNYETNTST